MAERPLARISPWLRWRAVDVVVDAEQVGLADGRGFLADRQVGRAAVVVLDALVVAAELDLVEHVLEGADDLHVALDADQVVARSSASLRRRRSCRKRRGG